MFRLQHKLLGRMDDLCLDVYQFFHGCTTFTCQWQVATRGTSHQAQVPLGTRDGPCLCDVPAIFYQAQPLLCW